MKKLKNIFAGIMVALGVILCVVPGACLGATNLPMADVGDHGDWMTTENLAMFQNQIRQDMTQFQSEYQSVQLVPDYVPIEAKIGMAMMNGFSIVAQVLDSSLVRFAIIFMIVAYIFWAMFEAYNMMKQGSSAMDFAVNLVKKGGVILIWSIVLRFGPTQVFMWVMGPIISIATYLADLILNAVSGAVGAELPDTCAAIRDYVAANTSENMVIDAATTADILCLPTRMSGFFTTAIAAGWTWMIAGIGTSAFTTLVGAVFIVLFIWIGFKFLLMALGVMMDLFLSALMLPFTAIAETVKGTSYKGIAGDIFNGFLGLFHAQSLSNQIQRFINAAIYFVSLAIVIAVCVALLAGTVDGNLAAQVPTLENSGFIPTLLAGCLVAYLANRAGSVAENIGGKINTSFGKKFGDDVKKLGKNAYGFWEKVVDIIRKKN